jgi:hypothetical protein
MLFESSRLSEARYSPRHGPTERCVALPIPDLVLVLRSLEAADHPLIKVGTDVEVGHVPRHRPSGRYRSVPSVIACVREGESDASCRPPELITGAQAVSTSGGCARQGHADRTGELVPDGEGRHRNNLDR